MEKHFISFPKSGRSWLRFALNHLGIASQIQFHHDGFEHNDASRPALDFSPETRLRKYADGQKIVYLQRDPRDVMVSLFHQITGRYGNTFNYTGTISDFLHDPYFGAENLHRFQSLWAELCADGLALNVSYESCHTDFPAVLGAITAHYGFSVTPAALAAATQAASFNNMKAVEQTGNFPEPWLRPRNGAPKVRRGKAGNYRDELTPEDIAYLNSVFSSPLP